MASRFGRNNARVMAQLVLCIPCAAQPRRRQPGSIPLRPRHCWDAIIDRRPTTMACANMELHPPPPRPTFLYRPGSYFCPNLGDEGYPKWIPRVVADNECKPISRDSLRHAPFPPGFRVLFYGNSHLRQARPVILFISFGGSWGRGRGREGLKNIEVGRWHLLRCYRHSTSQYRPRQFFLGYGSFFLGCDSWKGLYMCSTV